MEIVAHLERELELNALEQSLCSNALWPRRPLLIVIYSPMVSTPTKIPNAPILKQRPLLQELP